jgi:magnesium chelatase subunit D
MNPEEGELRPQLLDRFGLTVEVRASRDPGERAEVIRRRLAYDADPGGFAIRWATDEAALGRRIAQARERVAEVELPDSALKQIATVCAAFEVDGMRADLVTAHTAIAHAAWRGRTAVTAEDVREAARLSLPHRRRRDPFDAPGLDESRLDEILGEPWDPDDDPGGGRGEEADGQAPVDQSSEPSAGRSDRTPHRPPSPADATGHESSHETGRPDRGEAPGATGQDAGGRDEEGRQPGGRDAGGDHADPGAGKLTGGPDPAEGHASPPDTPYRTRLLTVPGVGAGAPGRRSRARTPHGRTSGARLPEGRVGTLHLLATLRAAAPYQGERGRTGPGLRIERSDLREAVREGREGNLVLFLVDASGSMAARQRMRAVKGAVLSLLLDAYQRRDKVGLVTFRGDRADLVLPPTSSVEAGAARLKDLRTGGRTPLAAGLLKAADVLRVERLRDPSRRPLLVVVTDGRATGSPAMADVFRAAEPLAGVASVVVDCESGPVRLGLAGELAFRLGARAVRLEDLAADGLTEVVRHVRKAA